MDNINKLPDDRKAILKKIWKCHQRVQDWIHVHKGLVSPNEMNVAQATLRELEEYTVAVTNNPKYRLSQPDMRNLNSYWKKYE